MNPNEMAVVIILNKKLEPGRAVNTAAHLAAGLANFLGEAGRDALQFIDFADQTGGIHPSISAKPFICLRAKEGELRTFSERARESALPQVHFTSTMTEGSWEDQLRQTAVTPATELVYCGVAAFGPRELLRGLSGKFSLWH